MACGKCVCSHALTGIRSSRRHLVDVRKSQLATESSTQNEWSNDFREILICRALRGPLAHNVYKNQKSSLDSFILYVYIFTHNLKIKKTKIVALVLHIHICVYIHVNIFAQIF